jgi:hypothetical protein
VGGYDTAWVPADCPASVFDEAKAFAGVVEEGCVWDARCVTALGRAEDGGVETERMQTIEWSVEKSGGEGGGDGEMAGMTGWVAFSAAEGLVIESHYQAWRSGKGKDTVLISVGSGARTLFGRRTGNRLEVRFDRMAERSLRTGAERRIRRGWSRSGAAAVLQAMVRGEVGRRWRAARTMAITVLQRTYRGHVCRRSLG